MERLYFLSNFLRLILPSETDRFQSMRICHTQGVGILWAFLLLSVVDLDLFAMHRVLRPLRDIAEESELIVIGNATKVESINTKWGNLSSAVEILEVLKGSKDILKINFFDNYFGGAHTGFFILFLKKATDGTGYYSHWGADGKYLLPQDEVKRNEIIALLKRHFDFLRKDTKSVTELKEIVLLELEAGAPFGEEELGSDEGDYKLLNSFEAQDQVRLFKVYEPKSLSHPGWMNFANILCHMKRSKPVLQLLTNKLRQEKDSAEIFESDAHFSSYFFVMCLVDASVEEDLGTGVPDNTPEVFSHVEKWDSFPAKKKQEIINGFFERVPFKEEAPTQSKPRR
jgi:hypothetical protein